jgi:citrate synthase
MNIEEKANLSEAVQRMLCEALEAPPDLITPELEFGAIPQWDSLGHMEVMMRLEEQYGVLINADTIAALVSVPAICAYIEAQNNGI